eukprot:TRINITY_DN6868_c0_g3_i3.p1 TRINITY_DN6868_c0_g3~~TRINITY_DN6868_c0_g3_i3.p1  ORF type:complete len:341 (+),score=87.85 TRINITY_DN6868_c0_g3_i3:38-1024(+)
MSIPTIAELRGHGRRIIETIDEKPPPVRMSLYLAPVGAIALLLSTFIASGNSVCQSDCVRQGESLEDRLLECMDRCEVGAMSKEPTKDCEGRCHKQVGYTRRQVQRRQTTCQASCDHAPFMLRFLAFAGVVATLPVVPFLGSYREACACGCCKGQGCSAKQAFFNVAWTAYGFSALWVLPTIAEEAADIGGKVLFIMTQGIAVASMASSRRFAEADEARSMDASYRMAEFGNGGNMFGATNSEVVGQAVSVGPAVQELHSQMEELQQKVLLLSQDAAAAKKEQSAVHELRVLVTELQRQVQTSQAQLSQLVNPAMSITNLGEEAAELI